jgi:hypothetical protein
MKSIMTALVAVLVLSGVALAQNTQVILAEDFDGLSLGPNVEEGAS